MRMYGGPYCQIADLAHYAMASFISFWQVNTSGVLLVGEDAIRHETILPNELYKEAMAGARWWREHVFVAKTYVEARSLFQLLLAFYRVYSLHLVLLVVMTITVGGLDG